MSNDTFVNEVDYYKKEAPKKTSPNSSYNSSPNSPNNTKIISLMVAVFIIAAIVAGALSLNKEKDLINPDENISGTGILDSDNDGLSDEEEIYYGTSINNKDTDYDGYSDFDEINNGFNPIGDGRLLVKRFVPKKDDLNKKQAIIDKLKSPNRTAKDLIDSLKYQAKSYFSIIQLIILFIKILFFGLGILVFAYVIRFVLRKFFSILIDIEKALTIAAIQTFSSFGINFVAGIIVFFISDFFLKLPVYLLAVAFSYVIYHYILKYFLHTNALKNVGIIIVTGLLMILVYVIGSVLLGLLLFPIILLLSAIF